MSRKLTLGVSVAALALAVCLTAPAARATVITSNGYITGISGLEVGTAGNYYDVSFLYPSGTYTSDPGSLNTPSLYHSAFVAILNALNDPATPRDDLVGGYIAFASWEGETEGGTTGSYWYGASLYNDTWSETNGMLTNLDLISDLGTSLLASFTNAPSPGQGSGAPVPEPTTVLLLGLGLICLAGLLRKGKRQIHLT